MNALPNSNQDSASVTELPLVKSAQLLDEWLTERGLDKEDGYFELMQPEQLASTSQFLGGSGIPAPCFRIVTHDTDDNPRPEWSRVRYGTKVKDERYRNPKGARVVVYAPLPGSFSAFESAVEVDIGEGEGKTMALVKAGRAALGIGGCWMWRGPDGRLLADIAERLRPGQRVNLFFDGDWRTNPDVHRAVFMAMQAVRDVGAVPLLVDLPAMPGVGKLGIDDQIKLWRDAGVDVTAALAGLPRLEEIDSPFVVDLKKPLDTARNFLEAMYAIDSGRTLVHWQDDFYTWSGKGWERKAEELLREQLYNFIQAHGSIPKQPSRSTQHESRCHSGLTSAPCSCVVMCASCAPLGTER